MTAPLRFPQAPSTASDGSFLRALSYTAGFADGLGSRRLAADATGALILEVLRVDPVLAEGPGFERALRARVDEASGVAHGSLGAVHSVEHLEGFGLSVVSAYTPGRRMSELAPTEYGPVLALDLIRVVTPALAALHQAGLAHGALSADRIVVTREGRCVVVDHVFGTAIATLELPGRSLNELGLVVPDAGGQMTFDARADMRQLGFLALSLLLRRRLDPADWPGKVPALLDELADVVDRPALAARMRTWLERAMQTDPTSFASAADALDASDQLPTDMEIQRVESARAMLAFPSEVTTTREPEVVSPPPDSREPEAAVQPATREGVEPPAQLETARARGFSRWGAWVIGGLVLLAAGEGAAVLFLAYTRPTSSVIEIRPPETQAASASVLAPLQVPPPGARAAGPEPTPPPAGAAAAAATAKPAAPPPAASQPPAPVGSRIGGLTVSSAVDLQVFKDGTLLGSTAGPIAVNDGAHSLEFVNEALGFRARQVVNVRNGLMTSVTIPVPSSRVNINAIPWADVTIDGVAAGETPIANMALPIGTHEIVFRHPQLGERKQTVVVKVGPLLRISQTFQ